MKKGQLMTCPMCGNEYCSDDNPGTCRRLETKAAEISALRACAVALEAMLEAWVANGQKCMCEPDVNYECGMCKDRYDSEKSARQAIAALPKP